MAIDIIKIFPPIGIARLGNSEDEFFIGPEIPGDHTPPSGGYKDNSGKIKRQAARFRLFGYEEGVMIKEITLDDASDIEWTVKLANIKAAWKKFGGIKDQNLPDRNLGIARSSLEITPEECIINGPNQKATFNRGKFLNKIVRLGEIQTDNDCRLIVLGGCGKSENPTNPQAQIVDWANNDGWYDDVSDGPVKASIRLKGSTTSLQAYPAWVICAPPKYAPPIDHIISLYDTLLQVAVDKKMIPKPGKPSFTNDIYPILVRASKMKWVTQIGDMKHRKIRSVIPDPDSTTAPKVPQRIRKDIFNRLRDPCLVSHVPTPDSDKIGDMPKIWSEEYDTENHINQSLTKTQYEFLKRWSDDDFNDDWNGPLIPETKITPEGLTRAALEPCVGAPFYPGIETSFMIQHTYTFMEPFRLHPTPPNKDPLVAGDLTKQMAIPWQADFYECSTYDDGLYWWPAHAPNKVYIDNSDGARSSRSWTDEIVSSEQDMISNWYKLGFVVQKDNLYVETQRHHVEDNL